MVSQEGSHFTLPPSRKNPPRRGDTPHPPSFGAGRDSPGPREERVYIEQGRPRVTFTAMVDELSLHFTIRLIGPSCSCSVPVPTERLTHGVPFED